MDQNQTLFKNEAKIFSALSHPSRLEILELLRDGECCVCHIQAMLEQRQAYISQHLNILRQAGLITSRKEGLRVYYMLSDPAWLEVMDRVKGILLTLRKWQPDLSNPEGLDQKKNSCTCPQCTSLHETQGSAPREVGYARIP